MLTAIVTIATLLHGFLGGLIGSSPGGGSDTFSLSASCRATTVTVRATYPVRFEGATVFFMFNDVLEDPQQTRNLPDATTFETTFDVARYLTSGRHIAVRVNNNEDVTLGSAETDCR